MPALYLIAAFIAAVVVIVGTVWLTRLFSTNRLGDNTQRGRMPRLAVIDEAPVDSQRRLVLIRRDNVEHLLMIGGKTDVVVETNIERSSSSRDQPPQRTGAAEHPRLAPFPEVGSWASEMPQPELLDVPEPQKSEPLARPSFASEARRPASAPADHPSDTHANFSAGQMALRPQRESRPDSLDVPEPQPQMPERLAHPSLADEARRPASALADHQSNTHANFSTGQMAFHPQRESRPEPIPQRLPHSESLISRPPRQGEASKVTPIHTEPAATLPPSPPSAPTASPLNGDQNLAEMAQRLEAALRRPGNEPVAPPVAPEPPPVARPSRSETPPDSIKTNFEYLEDEMASLLGRTKPAS